ncbi:MAG: hypothetical protein M2R45_00388 [Verrucomicrobia subdivision 3 bacterium]|nr:hypothetical protein [Limisphaerales bacterium]MCS1412853.1 hypothetical protein [Limisphaerales bacterium]
MQALLAIAFLTLKAAVRFRLLIVLGVLLLLTVIGLPLIIKDDGTAQGFTQILLTYTLSFITGLLGLATMWIACGTLARDIEEYQMQIVVAKPVARWQVWLGKWVGIMVLNGILLSLSGIAVFFLMKKRAAQLPEEQQAILRNEIFVARASAKEKAPDIQTGVDKRMAARLEENPGLASRDREFVRDQTEQQVIAEHQVVHPRYQRRWVIPVGPPEKVRDLPMYLRVKFFTASAYDTSTYAGFWEIGPPEGRLRVRIENSISPESPFQFKIPPNMVGMDENLTVDFINLNEKALLFPLDDGVEVLYKTGTFAPNFFRGMLLIYCWLGFLCALGLMAASFLSFPIAAFFTLSTLFIGFSNGTLSQIITEGGITGVDSNTGQIAAPSVIDKVTVTAATGLLGAINLIRDFSPVGSLSTGRLITWTRVAQGVFQIVVLMGGVFALLGIVIFTKRELAAAKSF